MINQARTSPLKRIQPSIQRSLTYNFTPEKIPVPEPDCQPAFDKFDKVEQEESHKMLKEIIFMERELESAKIELSLKPDFNLLDAFKMLDHHNKGWISFSELVEVLNRLFDIDTMSFAGRELLDLVFKRYDTNRDQKLSLAEFCKAFTPSGKEYAALV
jgi:Ca2+-binding EF-hand superfamily protein